MADKETGWFRTESGVILEMDMPLPEPIAQRVARGEIVRVANKDGDPFPEPKPKRVSASADTKELKAAQAQLAELTAKYEELKAENGELGKVLAEAVAERDALKASPSVAEPVKAPAKR